MKQTPVLQIPFALPEEILRLCQGAKLFDSSCSQEAKTYYIQKDEGYFLKATPLGQLQKEAQLGEYFHRLGLAPEVLYYGTAENQDLMLSRRAQGEDATHGRWLSEPRRLAALLGETLRRLHETSAPNCPVPHRNQSYVALAEENYAKGVFDASDFLGPAPFDNAHEAMALVQQGKEKLREEVLLHGDYCLPNVILNQWRFCAFIDVGNGGVGDRHVDLFWGLWSLGFNLKTPRYGDLFLEAYGQDKVDEERLAIVRAAESFG